MGRAKDFLQKITSSMKSEVSRETYGSHALFSEWKQDYALATIRDETGREPIAINPSQAGDKIAAPDGGQERTVQQRSLRKDLADSGWKLSRHDEHALSVYEKHCNGNSLVANPHDAGDWLKEFRRLNEEQRVDRLDAQKRSDQGCDVDR
jgi:hypothetical protein